MKETLSEELVSLEKEREVLEADRQELEKCQEERREWEEEKHSIVLQKLPLGEEQFEKKREQKLLDKKNKRNNSSHREIRCKPKASKRRKRNHSNTIS